MLAQGIDQDIGQGDVSAASLGFRRLEANAVRLGLLQRLADLNNLLVEIDARPAQCQDFA